MFYINRFQIRRWLPAPPVVYFSLTSYQRFSVVRHAYGIPQCYSKLAFREWVWRISLPTTLYVEGSAPQQTTRENLLLTTLFGLRPGRATLTIKDAGQLPSLHTTRARKTLASPAINTNT